MIPSLIIACDDTSITEEISIRTNFLDINIGGVIENPLEIMERIPVDGFIILVLVEPSQGIDISDLIQKIKQVNRNIDIVLLLRQVDLEVIRNAFRTGASDILNIPEELDELEGVLQRNIDRLKHQSALKDGEIGTGGGQLISVYSARGGSGKTFLSINLAQSLLFNSDLKVLLVDLNLQCGGIQFSLGLGKTRSMYELKPVIYELDKAQIDNVITFLEPSGLEILLGPADPELAEQFNDEHIKIFLDTCRRYYDYIILDLPNELDNKTLTALIESDKVLYVIVPDVPSLLATKNIEPLLEKHKISRRNKMYMVLNKINWKKDVRQGDIKKEVSNEIIASIRSDPRVAEICSNEGNPLILNSKKNKIKNGIARDILKLSEKIVSYY